ncbi:hypothetical protein N5079_19685 [Planotetraspora sp. A-T 1434]|uniref:hypothetical protein n=1 Tax=Planotetraspora sp. A-T 1434 TaxID=2979219 RepID=UPI0021C0B4A6|nr:hypothetical protein [Planotetraspora sp. A-T 1434]MCT9932426.1 hypothetical protein [Planotetraspora sp. A-T 1434]
MADEQQLTTEDRIVKAEIEAKAWCRQIAETLAEHLKTSTAPDAPAWSEALAWFAKRIKGGHLSIYMQKDFDQRFGPVNWSAYNDPTTTTEEGNR